MYFVCLLYINANFTYARQPCTYVHPRFASLSCSLALPLSLSLPVDKTVLLNAEQLCAVVAVLAPLAVCSTDLLSYIVYQVKSARLI